MIPQIPTDICNVDKTYEFSRFNGVVECRNYWIKANKLRLNVGKTNYIVFQNRSVNNYIPLVLLEDESLQCVAYTKFFGVFIDENLN